MPSVYTPTPMDPVSFTMVADGDAYIKAADVRVTLQGLANWSCWMRHQPVYSAGDTVTFDTGGLLDVLGGAEIDIHNTSAIVLLTGSTLEAQSGANVQCDAGSTTHLDGTTTCAGGSTFTFQSGCTATVASGATFHVATGATFTIDGSGTTIANGATVSAVAGSIVSLRGRTRIPDRLVLTAGSNYTLNQATVGGKHHVVIDMSGAGANVDLTLPEATNPPTAGDWFHVLAILGTVNKQVRIKREAGADYVCKLGDGVGTSPYGSSNQCASCKVEFDGTHWHLIEMGGPAFYGTDF